ncbi:MAG: PriCT-2 domain-containing protein [Candidatus Saccharibacteria bacterium]|nr:PriCT-2 domain-containing protein [Rhodoferax sp.]
MTANTKQKPRTTQTAKAVLSLTMNFGYRNTDRNPTQKVLAWAELVQKFSLPDLKRGTLPLVQYLALDKSNKEQKRTRDQEKNGPYFIMAAFSKPGTRDAVDVTFMSAFTGDIDSGKTPKEHLQATLMGYQYLAYSSYSHSIEVPMWRFLIPYSRPVTAAEHEKVYAYLQQAFGDQLDKRCKTTAQVWYTPACPPDAGGLFEFFTGDGILLDPDSIPDLAPKTPTKSTALVVIPKTPIKSLSVHQLGRVDSALAAISADDRDTWVRVGLALREELGTETGYKLWLAWSMKSIKFDADDAEATWSSFKDQATGAVVTLGSIFYLAKENGWIDIQPDMHEKVQALDDKHFMALEGGKSWVFKEDYDPELHRPVLTRMALKAFGEFYGNQKIAVTSAAKTGDKTTTEMVGIVNIWYSHPARRSFEKVVFMPGLPTPAGCYNLWRGFPIPPQPGSWALLHHHILDVICNGVADCFEYLLNWMAYAIQNPDKPGEVALVMQGERGTGKGKLAYLFGLLFGEHFLQVTQAKHLVGNFNAHLRNCVFLFVDEAFWAGDKQGENVLKGLVTEPTIQIEGKGANVITAANRLHIMMASNSNWVVPAGARERRFCVLQVNDRHIQDHTYFAAIDEEMLNQGGLAAMMHDLLNRDLSAFDVRKFPWTDALDEQLLHSLDPAMQWWMDYLGKTHASWEFPVRAFLSDAFAQANGTFNCKSSETKLGMFLSKVVPGGVQKVTRVTVPGANPQDCYQFPSQQDCRMELIKKLGLQKDPWL